jgi:hypothetical protein
MLMSAIIGRFEKAPRREVIDAGLWRAMWGDLCGRAPTTHF